MKQKFEHNKRNKEGPGTKSIFTSSSTSCLDYNNNYKFMNKGFVAWPPTKRTTAQKQTANKIFERRTKNGGYVAYPKEATIKSEMDIYYAKKAC